MHFGKAAMSENVIFDLLGASKIALRIFGTSNKRHLIPKLREQGWPICEVDGRPAANSDLLGKEIMRRLTVTSSDNIVGDSDKAA
jgi:hypothetical protein